jgi:hypothetical protein
VLSQECEVIVEPSTEASLPTRMLVQDSNVEKSASRKSRPGRSPVPSREKALKIKTAKNAKVFFFIGRLLAILAFAEGAITQDRALVKRELPREPGSQPVRPSRSPVVP